MKIKMDIATRINERGHIFAGHTQSYPLDRLPIELDKDQQMLVLYQRRPDQFEPASYHLTLVGDDGETVVDSLATISGGTIDAAKIVEWIKKRIRQIEDSIERCREFNRFHKDHAYDGTIEKLEEKAASFKKIAEQIDGE